jgi:hypothetical protein
LTSLRNQEGFILAEDGVIGLSALISSQRKG